MVSVDEQQGTIRYGPDAAFYLKERAPRTIYVGFARPSKDHQHGSFVLYQNMQFLFTANVFLEGFEDDQGALGFVVRGNCERVTS